MKSRDVNERDVLALSGFIWFGIAGIYKDGTSHAIAVAASMAYGIMYVVASMINAKREIEEDR